MRNGSNGILSVPGKTDSRKKTSSWKSRVRLPLKKLKNTLFHFCSWTCELFRRGLTINYSRRTAVYLVETLWKKSNPDKDINDWYSVERLTPWTGCLFASICGVPRVSSALLYLDLSPRWGGRSKDNFLPYTGRKKWIVHKLKVHYIRP
jgi:hypothetical protein